MKVTYFNNCWFTNVGEGFIDIGAYKMIKHIFGEETSVVTVTTMSDWYVDKNKNWKSLPSKLVKKFSPKKFESQYLEKTANLFDLYKTDYFVLAGMFATESFLNAKSSKLLLKIAQNGTKIIFLGLGGATYTKQEVEKFSRYLKQLNPYLVVTRDYATYENYKDTVNCISGIDCAFWIKDSFNPKCAVNKEFDIVTFNRTKEPEKYSKIKDRLIIKPQHFQYEFNTKLICENCMISDSPYDYISLYANASYVYTDLVHATVISLEYGTPVQFMPVDGRAKLFDHLEGLTKDENGFLHLDELKLENQKNEIISKIKRNINII
jgi:hypothetical protein